jgi:predicted nucleic acid-binding protein
MAARYLADKSAWSRMPRPEVSARLAPLIRLREIACCGINLLEILYSARSSADLEQTRQEMSRTMPWIATTDQDFQRATEVLSLLSRTGGHRSASLPDLLLAAVAERTGLTVLHYDKDYDAIAAVTGQPVDWVVPQGSVP